MKFSGCTVVADALNCQIETAEAIVEAKTDYLLSVKGNQKALMLEGVALVRDERTHKYAMFADRQTQEVNSGSPISAA